MRQFATPGSAWGYCNTGYWLLGAIFATVADQPYESAMREYVLDPLGLTDTVFHAEDAIMREVTLPQPPVAPGSTEHEQLPSFDYPRARRPSGGLVAPIQDVLTFAESQLPESTGPRGLSPESLRELHTPTVTAYRPEVRWTPGPAPARWNTAMRPPPVRPPALAGVLSDCRSIGRSSTRFDSDREPSGDRAHAMETFGMYGAPTEMHLIADPAIPVPVEPAAGYLILTAGSTSLARDGTDINVLAFHQYKPLENGFTVKLGSLYPATTPQQLVEGHKVHMAIEFWSMCELAAGVDAGLRPASCSESA